MPVTRTLITTLAIAAVAVPVAQAQDLRPPDAHAAAAPPSWATPGPPVAPWPATPGEDGPAPVLEAGADIDWAAISIGGAAAVLVGGGVAGLALGTHHRVGARRRGAGRSPHTNQPEPITRESVVTEPGERHLLSPASSGSKQKSR